MPREIDYSENIPNNVELASDRRLQRALENWQPRFADWWTEMGPVDFQDKEVYLRTAVDVGQQGWAHFSHVKLPDYRWGIFLSERDPSRRIGFGELKGQPVWQEIPGEFRTDLRRLIVVQGDTEPASVEQQRYLGRTAPSLYDLRNLFQINVEEGRHLWAMVYLLHAYFGRDGRDEADALLERHSGDPDHPRILGAFNEKTSDWLSFLLFTYFTDRDGKYQLGALKESAFDPLSRTCDFMLKEEAHHMFVGAAGLGRVVQRTCEVMNQYDTDDVRPYGVIDLPTLQKYINFHFSVSLDLFGSETSTNAANYYSAGLKGRFAEAAYSDDHVLVDHEESISEIVDGHWSERSRPAITVVNEQLRRSYIDDCAKGMRRWNRILDEYGIDQQLGLPHEAFHRQVGIHRGQFVTPQGEIVNEAKWTELLPRLLPTEADREYVTSLMRPVYEPGHMADWIAPPVTGINTQPVDYQYVRL
ncbi:MAG: benzoyl-CoA 2,3-epoxidase subunit BoxB [Actinomycetota bacterium]|nr:benzoyl-CoA 2,3-epoxidase subunit BoxB [Actinomycetota bacterium]